jgi:sec-independent protein translocase protein TatA
MHLGTGELVMLVVIILIVFSASRMASLGNAIGKFVYSFRKASQGNDLIDVTPTKRLERARDKTIEGGEKKS